MIIDINWIPPEGTAWKVVHWSTPNDLQKWIDRIKPPVIYRDKSGTYWIPVEKSDEQS